MHKTGKYLFSAMTGLTVVLWGGCKTSAPKPSGFLGDYSHLEQVNDSTWRYMDQSRLAAYQKFTVPPVSVLVKTYWGTKFTEDQKQRVGAVFRQKIMNALSAPYQVTGTPAADTAEIRVAITQAYRVGNALALGVEAEIVASSSHQQLAALSGVRIGPPEAGFRMGVYNPTGAGSFVPAWWNWPSATELMSRWADQVRDLVEEAHRR